MTDDNDSSANAEARRFDRQTRYAPFGAEGQAALEQARVLLVGSGALGGVLAQTLVRAGVGTLVLADRDIVEWSNLPRQVLFEESHAREGAAKALAARETLSRIGGPTQIEAHAVHVDAEVLLRLGAGADLILDGTDNLETRYLINDFSIQENIPWVYAGVVGASGLVLPVVPQHGACLACVFPEPPPAGSLPTCDTAGVLLPAVGAVASLSAGLALRLLAHPGEQSTVTSALVEIDVWNGSVRRIVAPRDPDCRACGRREFTWLNGAQAPTPVSLCGRNTVQIPPSGRNLDLTALAKSLEGVAQEMTHAGVLLRFTADGHRFTVFADGRALIEGTEELDRARSLYSRYISV